MLFLLLYRIHTETSCLCTVTPPFIELIGGMEILSTLRLRNCPWSRIDVMLCSSQCPPWRAWRAQTAPRPSSAPGGATRRSPMPSASRPTTASRRSSAWLRWASANRACPLKTTSRRGTSRWSRAKPSSPPPCSLGSPVRLVHAAHAQLRARLH